MELTVDAILTIMDHFDQSKLTKFSLEQDEYSLVLKKEKIREIPMEVAAVQTVAPVATAPVQSGEMAAESETGTVVKSPLVGTFYAAKEEGATPFVTVGDKVKKGDVIGIIEAMKLMNDIQAEADGTVAEIYVENEQLVEYGQPIIRIV
ncbi:MAG: acetyl-CoA carboxylase biotin carboxyl carrier protein [Lachnospiraceae bacterium]|nr:acetyl-CoA carboxylase biotin carboxyl carrier protein [Lachnospiraceae bacterium]